MYISDIKEKSNIVTSPSGNSIHWLLTKEKGMPNFELRYIEIPAGGQTSYGQHNHEHGVFIVKGNGEVKGKQSGTPYSEKLEAGRAVFIPGNEEHQWINTGDSALGIICVIPPGAEDQYKPSVE